MTDFDQLCRRYPGLNKAREDALATRDMETRIDDLMAAIDMDRREAVRLAQSLSKTGIAEFIIGRREKPSRLKWSPPKRSIDAIEDEKGNDVVHRPMPVKQHVTTLTGAIADAKRTLADALGIPETSIDIIIRT